MHILPRDDIEDTVNQIFAEVKAKGDTAVAKYTDMFDGIKLENTLVTSEEIATAEAEISEELKSAILLAKKNIEKFHAAQKTTTTPREAQGLPWILKKLLSRLSIVQKTSMLLKKQRKLK